MKYTIEHHSGLALLRYGSECRPATDVEVDLVAQLEKATASLAAVETQRPHWAKGYTDDSVAAQCAAAALSTLWSLLGVTNQTQAVLALQERLAGDVASTAWEGHTIYEAYQTWPEDLKARLSLQDLRRMSGWKPKSKEDQVIDLQEKTGVLSAEEALARRVEGSKPKGPDDAARLDWLERKAGKSYTGLTIDMRGDLRGFRLMWHHYATNGGHNNLRSAIDLEMAHES